jgi:ferredoxin
MLANPGWISSIKDLQLLNDLLKTTNKKQRILSTGVVVPERVRCVQCGICSYNCPIGIDVRQHAKRGASIVDSRCLTCGECVLRCPRGVLHFEYNGPSEILPTGAK